MVMDTIVASCTAPGAGALALIRFEGSRAREIASGLALLPHGKALSDCASHSIVYGHVIAADGSLIDQVLFLLMYAPRTFTGNDIVEITCHNNRFIVQASIARGCELGARHARPGEFTQRAVMNGKMDMLQAEALHELIMAPSHAVAVRSLAQLEGSLSQAIAALQHELFELAAYVEASFEFLEEEHLDLDFAALILQRIQTLLKKLDPLCGGQKQVQQLREGVKIALVGSVNAGKSTLLNALVGRKRAIVSEVPGTTRDSIEATVSDGGYVWTYIDTAGLRVTHDAIEQEGIIRSRYEAAAADIIMFVCDGSSEPLPEVIAEYRQLATQQGKTVLLVLTKSDKGCAHEWVLQESGVSSFCISAQTGEGLALLKSQILRQVKNVYEGISHPFILNQRQLALLSDMQQLLMRIQKECELGQLPYELLAAQLHHALTLITELSGRSVTEEIMDMVFSTFCIGK
jgi:tRNA modification GTPase